VTIYLLLVIVYSSRADWEKCKGPYRGEVRKIIEHNNELFALVVNNDGTSLPSVNYVVRSTDQGINWVVVKDISKPFNSINKYTLVVVNNIIYIFNNLYNSWSSTDNGESWSKLVDNSFFQSFSRFSESLEIYDFIKIKGRYVVLTDVGLYTTDNNGKSWEKVDNFSDNIFWDWYRGPSVVGKFYHVENVLYFTTNEGLYYSGDNGDTWKKNSVTDNAVFSFYVNDGIMYVSVEDGIYRSSDKGETWEFTWIKDNIIGYFSSRNDTLYCTTSSNYMNTASQGVLYSIDKGKNWLSNSVLRMLSETRMLYFNDSIMFVGTVDNGIYRSSDGGKNWYQAGYMQHRISALTSVDRQLIVGIKRHSAVFPHLFTHRIYKSSIDTLFWELNDFQKCIFYPGKTSKINSLFVNDSVIFAMFDGPVTNCLDNTLLISRDFGQTWESHKKMNVVNDSYVIFQEPYHKNDTLFLTTFNIAFNSFFSTDNGESWDTLSRKLTLYDNYVIAKAGKYFSLDKSLYVSNNQGVTWSELKIDESEEYYCLYEHEGTIYVSTDKGIYSTQDGIHWQNYGLSTMKASSLVVVDNYLYAGTDYGLYKRELLPSSIEEISFDSSIQLYPNPAQEFLYIKANTPYDTVSIYSILGDKVMDIVTSKDVIDISSLESGYYQVIVQSQALQQRASLSIMR
jgi:photosystem II stability/assembly factor-like uncharacterized protein